VQSQRAGGWRFRPFVFFRRRSPQRNAPRPAPLTGTQGRARRSRSRAESHSRHQRRRHVPQRLPARRTMIGAGGIGPHPIPLHFTLWIDTLNGGARHHGHSELPQWPPTHPAEVSSPWRPEIRGADRADLQFSLCVLGVSTENHPNSLWYRKKSVEKYSPSRPAVPPSLVA
jgi:hypothetical protein